MALGIAISSPTTSDIAMERDWAAAERGHTHTMGKKIH